MVTVAVLLAGEMTALLEAFDTLTIETVKVSAPSSSVSSTIGMKMLAELCPAGITTVI